MTEQMLRELIGTWGTKLIITIVFAYPTWLILSSLKDKWILKKGKDSLIQDMILSDGAAYQIGTVKGKFQRMDARRIILEEEIEGNGTRIHYVPLNKAIHETISRLDPNIKVSKKK